MFKYVIGGLFALFILVSIYSVYLALNKKSQLDRWQNIKEGMSDKEAIKIMGKGYVVNIDGNNTCYEWIANAPANYTGIRRVCVTCDENNIVKDISVSKRKSK